MDALKILVFNWRCWLNPEMGGAEVFTREVLKRWAEAGYGVTLFASRFKNCKGEEVVDGVRIVREGGKYSVYWKAKKFYNKCFHRKGMTLLLMRPRASDGVCDLPSCFGCDGSVQHSRGVRTQ